MNWSIIKNDFRKNKGINLALLSFIIFSSSLIILATLMTVQTFTAISELYKVAQPPHFLQMHKGDINQQEIDTFISNYDQVEYWQTVTTITVFGDSITVNSDQESYHLSDLRLDIGLVKQNETRDLLLDNDHQRVVLAKGEIGIPILLKTMYGMAIGEQVVLTEGEISKQFVIKEFVLDSQMNSPLTSSTRILLSDEDFESLAGRIGETEYLIEAYFTDTNDALPFKTAYENAGLPQNGQAVTYKMIFLLSALTNMITIFVMFLASILLVIVSFICIRFTIMSTLEEEVSEIGVMKAIGFPFESIRSIYVSKYRVLSISGVLLGYVLAFSFSHIFTAHISTTFGNLKLSLLAIVLSVLAAILIYLVLIFYSKRVLKKIKKLTVVDALVSGNGFDKELSHAKDGLYQSRRVSVDWVLSIREIVFHFKKWTAVFFVVMITFLMVLVPVNLLNTFEDEEFITYMGSSLEDILIEVAEGAHLESGYLRTKQVLEADQSILLFHEYRRVRTQTINTDNERINLDVDSGKNAGHDLKYLSGNYPTGDHEIAISYLNSHETGKKTGDIITLFYGDLSREFTVSGVYQDVTSGGYTSKAKFGFPGLESKKYSFSVNLKDQVQVEKKAAEWSDRIGMGVKVDPMKEFINQTLGGVTKQLRLIVFSVIVVGVCLVILITVLFLKLRLIKDVAEIASLKAAGFSQYDLRKQYMIKMGFVSTIGIVMGILVTNTMGDLFINALLGISGLGIKKVELIANPLTGYMIFPLGLLLLILMVTWAVTRVINKINIISLIKE